MKELGGGVAVVTGGASGIGRAMAERFARERAKVVVADIDQRALAAVVDSIKARGGEALGVPTDVTDLSSVQALAAAAFEAFGKVSVLCNNAGVALWGGLESATHRDWQWVLGVNLWGVIHGVEAFVPRMIASKEPGHIVNTASMAGLVATRGLGVYNTSKYAVVGLSETLAKDLRPYRIGVSVLCPMGVATHSRDSARNRPPYLPHEAPSASEPVELMRRTRAPAAVADAVLATPSVVTFLHAGDNDLVQLKRRGFGFAALFDTSIAARFLGAKALGLDVLLGTYLGVELPPSRQRDDWSRRPLSEAQRRYAEADVLHLFALRRRLTEELVRVGRLAWVEEECVALAAQPVVERVVNPNAFAGLKGARDLPPRNLGILRELYELREQLARAIDRPPFKILGEETLV